MSGLVTVKSYLYRHEAELDLVLLVAEGIEAMISADDAGGMQPSLLFGSGGARLLVAEGDAAAARLLLDSVADGD